MHAARCVEAGQGERVYFDPARGMVRAKVPGAVKAFVQVKLGHAVFCARILRPWITASDLPMWKLDLALPSGRVVQADIPSFKARQCSGLDGRCACAQEGGGAPQGGETALQGGEAALDSDVLVTRHNRLTGEPPAFA